MVAFPIDLKKFKKYVTEPFISFQVLANYVSFRLSLDPSKHKLSVEERSALQDNIQLLRDAIVLFTATGTARGVSGNTGGSGRLDINI